MLTKVKILNMTVSALVSIMLLNSVALSDDHKNKAKYYESCIVREIEKCRSKLVLLGESKSINLQDYARIKAKKAEFFGVEKDRLVKEMIEIQLDPKHYKVELFLNSQFQEWNGHRN